MRYKNNDYEVHCCCYWHFRQQCTVLVDGEKHVCANRTTVTISNTEEVITTTVQSLPLGSVSVFFYLLISSHFFFNLNYK